jgi:hypothetical protein
MKSTMIKSIIEEQIASVRESNLSTKAYFETREAKLKILLCRIVTVNHSKEEKLISDFIYGLALYPICLRTQNEKYWNEYHLLTNPVNDLICTRFQSDEFVTALIAKEISGEAILKTDGVEIPITAKEVLLHIRRIKASPLFREDIAMIEIDMIKYKKLQYAPAKTESHTTPPPKIEIKPIFKTDVIPTIYNLLKDYFPENSIALKHILETGNLNREKLFFNGNGKTLLDTFKQLMKGQFLIIAVQKDFEIWVSEGFEYFYRGNRHNITTKYASKIISGNERPAKGNRLIEVKNLNGKFEIVQLEIKNREKN